MVLVAWSQLTNSRWSDREIVLKFQVSRTSSDQQLLPPPLLLALSLSRLLRVDFPLRLLA